MTLSELKKNEKALISSIDDGLIIKNRLIDMGLVKNTELILLQPSVFGSPAEIFIRGFKLTLRKCDCDHIRVEKL